MTEEVMRMVNFFQVYALSQLMDSLRGVKQGWRLVAKSWKLIEDIYWTAAADRGFLV